jgi:hypothetical protein
MRFQRYLWPITIFAAGLTSTAAAAEEESTLRQLNEDNFKTSTSRGLWYALLHASGIARPPGAATDITQASRAFLT